MHNVYQEIVEGLPVLICRFLPEDGTITLVNEAYCRYFGKTREDLIGTSFLSLITKKDRAEVKQHFTSLTRDNPLTTSEHPVNTPSGIRWQRWTFQALFDENGVIGEYQSIGQDITEQKTYEQVLSQKEETLIDGERRYREILENIEEGYYEVDLKGNFTFFNDSMCRILGYPSEELMGMNNMALMDSENGERVYRTFNSVFRTGIPSKACDLKLTRKNGATCFLEASVSLVRDPDGNAQGFRGITRDITDTKNQESIMHHTQKMEAIGTLAGGIAHDFNNILSSILGFTELALMESEQGSSLHKKLEQVQKSGNRAKDLVKQILLFSRQGEYERKPIHIMPVVEDALKMLRATLPSSQEIYQVLDAADAIIEADPTQIHQIVINLCTNAFDAVRDTGGFIEVKLSGRDIDDGTPSNSVNLHRGSCVELIVTDTGCGMAPEVMDRIFDPYYTTKEKGKGTGLGLAIVHGIVKGLGGSISVQSILGKGTTFSVLFPQVEALDRAEEHDAAPIPTGHEHVLFVDDEEDLTEMVGQMLSHLGYHVTTRTSSVEALDLFRANPESFDIVISDLVMPKLTGENLAQNIMKIRGDIPVMICTGFSEALTEEQAHELGIRMVLMKPLVLREIAHVLRSVLDGGRSASCTDSQCKG